MVVVIGLCIDLFPKRPCPGFLGVNIFPSWFCEVQKTVSFMLCRICDFFVWQLLTTFQWYYSQVAYFKKPCLSVLLTFSLSFSENDVLLGCCPAKLCQHVMLNNVLRHVKTTQKQSRLYQQSITRTINYGKPIKIKALNANWYNFVYFFDTIWAASQ